MSDTPATTPLALRADELCWRCDTSVFARFRAAPEETPTLIGQPRAIEALRLGLTMDAPGHNIFVCGPSGTGKMSTVRALLKEKVQLRRQLVDCAYVRNFVDPDRPKLLTFPAGIARRFRRALEALATSLPELLRNVLDSEPVDGHRRAKMREVEELERQLIADFEGRCRAERFALTQVQVGETHHIDILPVYKRKPIDIEELNDLVTAGEARVAQLPELNRRHAELKDELRSILGRLRRAARSMSDAVHDKEVAAVRRALEEPIAEVGEEFPYDGVAAWLEQLAAWVAEHVDELRDEKEEDEESPVARQRETVQKALRVNIVLDNALRTAPPVVFENSPTFTNVFGTVERPSDELRPTVDFMDIKPGSLLRAHGGYLVVNANDAAPEAGVWRTLTRVLKTRELEIQSPEQFFSPGGGGSALKPEPIPVDVKVIAVGDEDLYRALHNGSDDFQRVFKIKADFDDVMPLSDENLAIYARHAWRVEREEHLLPLTNEALGRLAEYGVRLAERQEWLSTRFSDLTDVLREAHHYAIRAGADHTERVHVQEALEARNRRHALVEDRMRHVIRTDLVHVSTAGSEVGAANALTVVDLGDHAFGQPCRISATCAPGHKGVVSVEREVRLSGRLHDKGTMLLTAYLRSHYLPERVLALSATVAFEQLHDEVDGDSASVAEALALLSSLAEQPLNQSIATTGAIDQKGRVLAVGGLNEKIEGFFAICAERGLSGAQGVVIPYDNRADLILDQKVVDAVQAGLFHIWAVKHIDEAVLLVAGVEAGQRGTDGRFPESSLNGRVQRRLEVLADRAGPLPRKKSDV